MCVAIFRDNPFGIVVRDNHVFTFKKGNLEPPRYVTVFQETFASLTELVVTKKRMPSFVLNDLGLNSEIQTISSKSFV